MSDEQPKAPISRRTVLTQGAQTLAGIAVVFVGVRPSYSKAKAAKDDFFFQEDPGENGKRCETCVNFTPKTAGQYGADSGDCALLEGDVCKHCYCQGWTDKKSAGAKKAGT